MVSRAQFHYILDSIIIKASYTCIYESDIEDIKQFKDYLQEKYNIANIQRCTSLNQETHRQKYF